ncbi:hypothetical protein SHJG_1174 [Streptomyces hygroscopicus subsp. jinggangensis 5008]|nr:hypothetical protein SHJG_1174 [Streptomyces hygroscopicus subsp. jinggangensis 5008]AGF60675.1 hypothetical protein SHJGH_1009 [Streptomyces hygroscopicus subsp. jinggangensis TL01]
MGADDGTLLPPQVQVATGWRITPASLRNVGAAGGVTTGR